AAQPGREAKVVAARRGPGRARACGCGLAGAPALRRAARGWRDAGRGPGVAARCAGPTLGRVCACARLRSRACVSRRPRPPAPPPLPPPPPAPAYVPRTPAPPGAKAYIDRVPVGTTPLSRELPAGEHAFMFELAGFELHQVKHTLEPGDKLTVDAPLA